MTFKYNQFEIARIVAQATIDKLKLDGSCYTYSAQYSYDPLKPNTEALHIEIELEEKK